MNFIKGKSEKITIIIFLLLIIISPIAVAYLLSFRLINTDTTNEWIGFWGGYLGAIFGGIITLTTLYFTVKDNQHTLRSNLKFESERMKCDRKRAYNDMLLNDLIEYQTWLEEFCAYIRSTIDDKNKIGSFTNMHRIGVILSKRVYIKLACKKGDNYYKYTEILLNNISDIVNEIDELIQIDESKDFWTELSVRQVVLSKKSKNLMKHIEKYYVLNEENELKIFDVKITGI